MAVSIQTTTRTAINPPTKIARRRHARMTISVRAFSAG
jgi:hypothetical protein